VPELAPLYPVSRRHLDVLTTEIGIMQHAQGTQPNPDHGYCTDDVARALLVDLLHQRELGWEAVESSAARHVSFLAQAFEGSSGRFRNFRRIDGAWLDVPGSEDANARALHALGEAIVSAPASDVRAAALALFEKALPTASRVNSLRPLAAVLLACDAAARAGMVGEVLDVYARVGDALRLAFETRQAFSDWPWPEALVTYENELPVRALIIGGRGLGRPRMAQVGLAVLDWLIDAQTTEEGRLSTVGNVGWWPKGGRKARFDQQPISATTLLLAADSAHEATGSPRYSAAMEMSYGWFTGRNDALESVAEPGSGACRDGIGPDGVSQNQGAESTLMWHIAAEHIRALRAGSSSSAHTRHG